MSVGARNFERGLSVDGPLYGTIARNIALSQEWFRLDASVPDFQPFSEHPHLGFWTLATLFKYLPIDDWSARIPGHVFYIIFLFIFFKFLRKYRDEKSATVAVLLLWIWPGFSNYFSNTYLDPGCLVFGFLSFYYFWNAAEDFKRSHLVSAAIAGVFLALAFMQKGLTALGFGLPLFLSVLRHFKLRGALRTALSLFCFFLVFLAVMGFYIHSIQTSADPEFLNRYWARQFTNRFSQQASFLNILDLNFWYSLLKSTHFIAIASVYFIFKNIVFLGPRRWNADFLIPGSFFLSFVLLYAPAQRHGAQYWIMLMPWLAWMSAIEISKWVLFQVSTIVRFSTFLSLSLVCLVQYGPFRTHKSLENESTPIVRNFSDRGLIREQIIDDVSENLTFITTSKYAWYGNTKILLQNRENPPFEKPHLQRALVMRNPSNERIAAVKKQGWCLYQNFVLETLFLDCSKGSR